MLYLASGVRLLRSLTNQNSLIYLLIIVIIFSVLVCIYYPMR
ncbi:hypothetical protein EUBHAL_03192 [Anaerobutyricum hallii DSM 3353]|uniref:Uncharacterized protein n=1 Tax=Anaerobutyricum hallii DSM 3353 TaxID=411469 RepID=C0F0H1_9FIRM|nr:hypothetical protein EUBHAL_03192 [Anaerobutyricum hallii DSM 3353]